MPLQVVREWLGHVNISQTSTYLESTLTGQHEAMRRFDEARGAGTLANRLQNLAREDGKPVQTEPMGEVHRHDNPNKTVN